MDRSATNCSISTEVHQVGVGQCLTVVAVRVFRCRELVIVLSVVCQEGRCRSGVCQLDTILVSTTDISEQLTLTLSGQGAVSTEVTTLVDGLSLITGEEFLSDALLAIQGTCVHSRQFLLGVHVESTFLEVSTCIQVVTLHAILDAFQLLAIQRFVAGHCRELRRLPELTLLSANEVLLRLLLSRLSKVALSVSCIW